MTTTLLDAPVSEYAIIVDAKDNVAVVKTETAPGLELLLPEDAWMRRLAAALRRTPASSAGSSHGAATSLGGF